MAITWTKVSSIDLNLNDDAAIAAVTIKANITDLDTDPDVSEGDLLIQYEGSRRIGYQYHTPHTPTPEDIKSKNRSEFNSRRSELIEAKMCDHARARIQAEFAQGAELTIKYVNRVQYMDELLDLPETQANFETVIASETFNIDDDIDWPTVPA